MDRKTYLYPPLVAFAFLFVLAAVISFVVIVPSGDSLPIIFIWLGAVLFSYLLGAVEGWGLYERAEEFENVNKFKTAWKEMSASLEDARGKKVAGLKDG